MYRDDYDDNLDDVESYELPDEPETVTRINKKGKEVVDLPTVGGITRYKEGKEVSGKFVPFSSMIVPTSDDNLGMSEIVEDKNEDDRDPEDEENEVDDLPSDACKRHSFQTVGPDENGKQYSVCRNCDYYAEKKSLVEESLSNLGPKKGK
jgi:hypothetical protein